MNIKVNVTVSDQLKARLQRIERANYAAAAGINVFYFLRDYHTEFAPRWRGQYWIPSSKSGQFAQSVVDGWRRPTIKGGAAVIVNTFGLLAWKLSGGTITPKIAKALTIPLTTAARSSTARNFPGGNLFIAGNTLSLQLGAKIEAQYALVKSVTQKPWPGAMPPDEDIAKAALQGVEELLDQET